MVTDRSWSRTARVEPIVVSQCSQTICTAVSDTVKALADFCLAFMRGLFCLGLSDGLFAPPFGLGNNSSLEIAIKKNYTGFSVKGQDQ